MGDHRKLHRRDEELAAAVREDALAEHRVLGALHDEHEDGSGLAGHRLGRSVRTVQDQTCRRRPFGVTEHQLTDLG
jgi:hypothetical protein